MSQDFIPFNRSDIRWTDGNSLLRMYDQAAGVVNTSTSPTERAKADRSKQLIAKELRKRKLAF
jgi:hypothetical protein